MISPLVAATSVGRVAPPRSSRFLLVFFAVADTSLFLVFNSPGVKLSSPYCVNAITFLCLTGREQELKDKLCVP